MTNIDTARDLACAFFDAEHVKPVHIAMGLEAVAGRLAGNIDPATACAERLQATVDECREMLKIADRLYGGRPRNDSRLMLDTRLSMLADAVDRS